MVNAERGEIYQTCDAGECVGVRVSSPLTFFDLSTHPLKFGALYFPMKF